MAKGGSASQANTLVARGGGANNAATAPPTAAGLRKRSTRTSSSSGSLPANRGGATSLNFYTDDQPGLKMSPWIVVVMSIGFVCFVAVLHIFGKLRS